MSVEAWVGIAAEVLVFVACCAYVLARTGKADREAQDAVYSTAVENVRLKQDVRTSQAYAQQLRGLCDEWREAFQEAEQEARALRVIRTRLLDDRERIAYDRDLCRAALAYMVYERDAWRARASAPPEQMQRALGPTVDEQILPPAAPANDGGVS